MSVANGVRERLLAYIAPRKPTTIAEADALERAINAQEDYEEETGTAAIPGGVSSFSIGDFSATVADGARYPAYTRETISPVAWSILRNAGLIAYSLPTARRP